MPIFLMTCVFLMLCLLYGIHYIVHAVTGRIRSHAGLVSAQVAAQSETEALQVAQINASHGYYVDELRSLFALYQSGALTKDEFEQLKQHLVARMTVHI